MAQTRPPVEAFAQLPSLRDPCISPDGKHLAAIQTYRGRAVVAIYDLDATSGVEPAVVEPNDAVIDSIRWAKNDRLAITLKKATQVAGDTEVRTWVREETVSEKGKDAVVLNANQGDIGNNVSGPGLIDVDLDDPDTAFMPLAVYNLAGEDHVGLEEQPDQVFRLDLLSVNVRTGRSHSFMTGTVQTKDWFMDGHGHVVARIDRSIHWRTI